MSISVTGFDLLGDGDPECPKCHGLGRVPNLSIESANAAAVMVRCSCTIRKDVKLEAQNVDLAPRCSTIHAADDDGGESCLRCDTCQQWVRPSAWAAHQARHEPRSLTR